MQSEQKVIAVDEGVIEEDRIMNDPEDDGTYYSCNDSACRWQGTEDELDNGRCPFCDGTVTLQGDEE
jgi:hypothetical protein